MTQLTDTIEQDLNALENAIEDASEGQEEASTGKKSLRSAINQTCRDCIYDEHAKGEGNWRQQVEKCKVSKCGLYEVRPVSKPRKNTDLPSTE